MRHKIISLQIPCNDGTIQIRDVLPDEGLKMARQSMAQEWPRFASKTYKDARVTQLEADRFRTGRNFLKNWLAQQTPHTLSDYEPKLLHVLGAAMQNHHGAFDALQHTVRQIRALQPNAFAQVVADYYQTVALRIEFISAIIKANNDLSAIQFSKKMKSNIDAASKDISSQSIVQRAALNRIGHVVAAIEQKSVDRFDLIAKTVDSIVPHLASIRAGIGISSRPLTAFSHLTPSDTSHSFSQSDWSIPLYLIECHGKNGQNVYGVLTHLRDTVWDLGIVKDVLREDYLMKPGDVQKKTAFHMVRTLFALETPFLNVIKWAQTAPRHAALDWPTAILLNDIAKLTESLWDFDPNTTKGMKQARDRWLAALHGRSASCVCTVS